MANCNNLYTKSSNINSFSFVDFINKQYNSVAILVGILIIVCSYDLFSPPISVTIYRQAQTAMLTDNFLREGFSLKGLYVGLKGDGRLMMTYEFPIYNFIVGLFFRLFGNNPFWGKLISLIGAIITLTIFNRLVKTHYNNTIAFYASLFFIFLPVDVLMFTSFQPDAIGVMFLLIAIFMLDRWRKTLKIESISVYSISILLCGLCKFPIFVPYMPLFCLMYFFPRGKFRFPRIIELIIISLLFILPFLYWYTYRKYLTDSILLSGESGMFLFGDLTRLLSLDFYIRLAIMIIMMVFCGSGIIYFLSGLRNISAVELVLLAGVPLYYIVVPTVANQYYYLYPIAPIGALFMAKGVSYSIAFFSDYRIKFLNYILLLSIVLFSAFGITYVLRKDTVILPASEAMREVSQSKDLIFVVNMHDRGSGVGGNNPTAVYFTGRNGWNIQNFDPYNYDNIIVQIDSKIGSGAKWLFVTWYTSDLEPWYSVYLPKQFNRSLKFDSQSIVDKLKRHYPVARIGKNFAIMDLAQKGN